MTDTTVKVETGGRLHFGFSNLSLAHERLYGASGVALRHPRLELTIRSAGTIESDHDRARRFAHRACELLDVAGAEVTVERMLPEHMGLGSGTQLALSVLAGVASAHGEEPRVRDRAPALGRGGRSGIGVAAFDRGGFMLDAGHPTELFTSEPPPSGGWDVPSVVARHPVPDDWRFLLVIPDTEPGRSGADEEAAVRTVVEEADPSVADRIAGTLVRRMLPAVAAGDRNRFGSAVQEVGRLNGTWFADTQGGVYRPPVGELVASLDEAAPVSGVGQSSWGPTVFAVTGADHADAARTAGERALAEAGLGGEVSVVRASNSGAEIRTGPTE